MQNILGFETIFDMAATQPIIYGNLSEETYCPDCYDCDVNCTEADCDQKQPLKDIRDEDWGSHFPNPQFLIKKDIL